MWMLSGFYFFTLLIVCVLNRFPLPENFWKIMLCVFLLVALCFKRKINNVNAATLSLLLFLVVAFYSAARGLDFNYSWPLIAGFFILYIFVKSQVETLNLAELKKTIVYHSIIANGMILLMWLSFCFYPTLIHPLPGNYHPYTGLAGVVGTSAAVLLAAMLINTQAFFCFKRYSAKFASAIFFILAVLGIVLINARTAEVAVLVWLLLSYLLFVSLLKDNTFKQSSSKLAVVFFSLLVLCGFGAYLLHHFDSNNIIFHQTGDIQGIDLGGRVVLWIASIKSFLLSNYLWGGVGYGNQLYFLELNRIGYQTAHNIFLDMAFGTGLIGLSLFLCFIVFSLLDSLKNSLSTKSLISAFFFIGLLVLLVQSQAESSLDSLLTTNLYIYFLFYEMSLRFKAITQGQ